VGHGAGVRALATLALLPLFELSTPHARVRAEEAAQAHAVDELDLVRLLNVQVSTATKTAENIDDAPAIITVVTYDDIVRWGYQSVAEVLTHTVGFYVLDDHVLPNVGVRGTTGGLGAESGVIKVMIDGRSVAYRTTSGNWLGVELVPLEAVQQIEIIRGPASALYGADAFLGVVNIITRSPDKLRPVRARAVGGVSGDNPGGQFDVAGGTTFGDYELMLGAAAEYKDRSGLELPSESPAPVLRSDVGGRDRSRDLERRSLVLTGRIGTHGQRWGRVRLDGYVSGIERGGDFAHWAQLTAGRDADGHEVGTTVALGHYRVNLDVLAHLVPNLDLSFQSTFFQGSVRPNDRVEIASDVFYVERKFSYLGTDTTLELRYTPLPSFNVIVGTELLLDHENLPEARRVQRDTGESVPVQAGEGRPGESVDLINVGAYLSANYKLYREWLKLTGGMRYDHHSKYGDKITGRLGMTSRLPGTLVAKVLYGSAFKAPSPYLLYAVPLRPGDVIGNSELKPQYIHTLEGQLSASPWKFLRGSTGISHSWLLDKAEFTPQGINQAATNVASQRSLSWESRLDGSYGDDVDAYGAFELVRSRRELGQEGYAADLVGRRNVVYPPWIVRAGVAVRIPSVPSFPLEAALQTMVAGPRRAADASIVEAGRSFELPTYALLNASLSTRELYLIRGHETRIALRGKNLLGASGPDPGFSGYELPLAARELLLELRHVY
jgi:outer membrane receptor for ferrienterochelin and colicins